MQDFPQDQISELKALNPDLYQYVEAGVVFFLLKDLHLPNSCIPDRVDTLLCPTPRDGYPSRLFFASKVITPQERNWNKQNERIIERNWFAFSWMIKGENLRLIQILAAHLDGMR
jgi:hypothetical protein